LKFPNNVAKGDVIIVGTVNDVNAPETATDTLGDTFVAVASSSFTAGPQDVRLLLATTTAAGADSVTINAGSGNKNYNMSILEYSGLLTTSISAMIDTSSTNFNNTAGTTYSTGNMTTQNANDLVFAFFNNGNNTSPETITTSSPLYTKRETSNAAACSNSWSPDQCFIAIDRILTTTTTTNATVTANISDGWGAVGIALKAAASTVPGVTKRWIWWGSD
jgi:hypothetical protein